MNQIFFTGVIESRNDPLQLGRMRVRVFGVHSENLDDVPTSALPWAICLMPATSASLSGIGETSQYIEGTLVSLYFQDGESRQQPMIMGSIPGIPLNQSPFGTQSDSPASVAVKGKVTSTVRPTAENTLSDSSGTPVTDSSGAPVETEATTEVRNCCSSVDTTKMVAKFGSGVTDVCKTLCDFGIKDPYAVVAILSNIAKECKYVLKREGMNYSSTARLREIFKTKFGSMSESEAQTYVNNEEKLANFVYANSDGNGSVASGDGFAYRGGGYIQLTKKNNYSSVGSKIGVDLVAKPEEVTNPKVAAKVVAQYFVNRFGGANRLKFSSLDEALQAVTKKVNPGGFANDYPKVVEFSKLCKISISDEQVDQEQAEKETEKPNAAENDVKPNATKKEIDSGIVAGKPVASGKVVPNIGFTDPNKKYPLPSYLKEQDTNRLARRSTAGTAVASKLRRRRSGIRSIGSTFNEPAPAYNAEYPYNHVYATESGHVHEFDDSPGRERIQTFHTSGTYEEIDKYGNKTNKIVGDGFTIVERNGYIYIDGTARITIGSDVKLVVGGNLDVEVDGNINYNVGGDVNYRVGGAIKYGVGSSVSVNAGGDIAMDSSMMYLQSGNSEAIGSSARSGTSTDYAPLIPDNFLDTDSFKFDDADGPAVDAYHKKAIQDGTITQKELDDGDAAKPEVVDEKPPAKIEPVSPSCAAFSGKTDIPDSTQLSKSFTLAMVSTKAKAGGHKVKAQHGLSESQIVCNLKGVAENCLDKIKAQYPNMYVTSGFRVGNSTSQHELGQACDMQFDVPNSEYFAIAQWIRDNVVFDKLLLEYKTNRSGKAWIHVTYRDGCRKEVYTFMNDKNAGTGLRKLQ